MHINTIQTECSLLNTVQKALQNGARTKEKAPVLNREQALLVCNTVKVLWE